jgi:hypothetical protein
MTDLAGQTIKTLFWDATKKEFRELWYAEVKSTESEIPKLKHCRTN